MNSTGTGKRLVVPSPVGGQLKVRISWNVMHTACSQRASSMLPILLEVSDSESDLLVDESWHQPNSYFHATYHVSESNSMYTRATACSQRATSMLLILLEVTVKVTYWLTRAAKQLLPCYLLCWKCQRKQLIGTQDDHNTATFIAYMYC